MRPGASDGRKNGTTRRIYERAAFIQSKKSSGAYEVFQSAVNQTGLTVTPVWESTSQTTLMEAVHYGLGVTIVPEQMIKKRSKRGAIIPDYLLRFLFPEYDSYSLSS